MPNGEVVVDWEKIGKNSEQSTEQFPNIPLELQMKFGIFSLQDLALSPTQLMNGLINFRKCMAGESYPGRNDISQAWLTFAKTFAKTSSTLAEEKEEVGPFPGALFAASSLAACISQASWPLEMPELVPGQRTIIIVHEYVYPYSRREKGIPDKTGMHSSLAQRKQVRRFKRMLATGSLAWKDFFWT